MKYAIALFLTFLVMSCSHGPIKILRANCESAEETGRTCPLNSLCYCEDLPEHQVRDRN